jgi:hypothetical protein
MRIQFITSYAEPAAAYVRGKTYDVDDETGATMVDHQLAIVAIVAKAQQAVADSKPRETKETKETKETTQTKNKGHKRHEMVSIAA